MDKVTLTEAEQREVDMITEEFNARGGMSDEEIISRFGAIPFDEFMKNLAEQIANYDIKNEPENFSGYSGEDSHE